MKKHSEISKRCPEYISLVVRGIGVFLFLLVLSQLKFLCFGYYLNFKLWLLFQWSQFKFWDLSKDEFWKIASKVTYLGKTLFEKKSPFHFCQSYGLGTTHTLSRQTDISDNELKTAQGMSCNTNSLISWMITFDDTPIM